MKAKDVSDPEFAKALDQFIADFAADRGLSWECACEALIAKFDEMQAELKKNE